MEYTVDYFIKKFEAIPEEKWCINRFQDGDKFCAQGFCGMNNNNRNDIWNAKWFIPKGIKEAVSLFRLFQNNLGMNKSVGIVGMINNGRDGRFQQSTPKQRILAALYTIKGIEQPKQPETNERIVYVAFDSDVKKLKETITVN